MKTADKKLVVSCCNYCGGKSTGKPWIYIADPITCRLLARIQRDSVLVNFCAVNTFTAVEKQVDMYLSCLSWKQTEESSWLDEKHLSQSLYEAQNLPSLLFHLMNECLPAFAVCCQHIQDSSTPIKSKWSRVWSWRRWTKLRSCLATSSSKFKAWKVLLILKSFSCCNSLFSSNEHYPPYNQNCKKYPSLSPC